MQRPWRMLLTGLHLMACSVCFLIEPRTTSPQMAPSTRGWALPHQSLIQKKKKCLTAACYGALFNLGSLLSDNVSLCQVDIKLAHTVCKTKL
jgi:hypothetical protein